MDRKRFDALARLVASPGSRRQLLSIVASLGLAGLRGQLDDASTEARRKRHGRRRGHRPGKRKDNRKGKRKRNKGGGGLGSPNPCTPDGGACQQNGDCCGGNCFNQVCAAPVTECAGVACQGKAAGCCPSGCCESRANQCNGVGECCVPNCTGRRCGPDGCGNEGTCGTCPSGSECDKETGLCGCTPQTCPNGCCDANGDCQPGNTEQACGDGGVTCTQCGSNQHCSTQTGTCRDNPPCSAETCPNGCCFEDDAGFHVCRTDLRGCTPGGPCCSGCCDENDACQDGDADGECGAGGSRCVACNPLDRCDQGRCQCNANNCPGCCDNGPGNPGFCEQGNTNDFCGFGGVLCVECPTGTTCNGQGECTCINSNQFCGSGDQCIACPDGTECIAPGQCECTAQSCPASSGRSCQDIGFGVQCLCDLNFCQGCCVDGLCNPGNTPQACLTNAGACTECAPGDQCVDSAFGLKACCPAGQMSCTLGECCPDSKFCCEETCCDTDCCGDLLCCRNGVDCCNDQCCEGGSPHCCQVDEDGTLACVSSPC